MPAPGGRADPLGARRVRHRIPARDLPIRARIGEPAARKAHVAGAACGRSRTRRSPDSRGGEMADRILTTHAGSLPRPDELADMVWARMDGEDVDEGELEAKIDEAVVGLVAKQREVGLDVISDGEMSKPGFSTYVSDRFSGFAGTSEFQSDDVAPFPELAMKLFANAVDGAPRLLQLRRAGGAHRQGRGASRYRPVQERAGRCGSVERRSWGRSAPGRSRSTIPTSTTGRTRSTWRRARTRSSYEYRAIIDAGFNLADRFAGYGDGGALAVGREQRRGLAPPSPARGRGAERGARGDPARAGPVPRVLGQHRHSAPPRHSARGHHRPGAQGQRRHDLRRGRQPPSRARVARVPRRGAPGRQVA